VTFDYVAEGATSCFFGETTGADVPTVEFKVEARDATGALIVSQIQRYKTYPNPRPGNSPVITFLTGPATAHLDEAVVFGVFWKDADGDAVKVSLSVQDSVLAGTDETYLVERDVSNVALEDQKAGHETLFGVQCKSVDSRPRTMTITVTDRSGFSATRTATFACVE
jgi:hypothetical protein